SARFQPRRASALRCRPRERSPAWRRSRRSRVPAGRRRRAPRYRGSYPVPAIAEQGFFLTTSRAPPQLAARNPRPHLVFQEFAEPPMAVAVHDAQSQSLAPFLERAADCLRLRLAGQPRNLLDETLDVRILDVERHGLAVFHHG